MHEGSAVPGLVGAIVALLVVASVVRAVVKRTRLPFTVVLVVLGIVLSETAQYLPSFLDPVVGFELSSDLILFVFVPTLVFQSAADLDSRLLRRNLRPVLLLAVPGLLLSTGVIGGLLALVTALPLDVALLLGAILSATDPVAVVGLFGQLGAPARLTVLVEGESLMNDATSIVVSRILLAVVLSGAADATTLLTGAWDFVRVFVGGLVIGGALAFLVGWLIGLVDSDPKLEVPLTVTLAYASFLIAEHWLGVSGVMATVAAGLVLGGWGRTRVSPDVEGLLDDVWEQLAFGANALIFLLVGLRVDLSALGAELDALAWVVAAMLVARAAVIFGLLPVAGRLPRSLPVDRSYQAVMWWGGLRGAISLALVLSLPTDLTADADLVALVMGAVLFTLLVQGLSIERLVVGLGLDRPPLAYRWARAEVALEAVRSARQRLSSLRNEAMFSARVGRKVRRILDDDVTSLRSELDELRNAEVGEDAARRILWLRLLAVEKSVVWDLFSRSHITGPTARQLDLGLDLQIEHMRERGELLPYTVRAPRLQAVRRRLLDLHVPGTRALRARFETLRTAQDYERSWAQYHAAGRALDELDHLVESGEVPEAVVDRVRETYEGWREASADRLDGMAEQFPEFVEVMQRRQALRLVLDEQRQVVDDEESDGLLPSGAADDIRQRLARETAPLRGLELSALELDLDEMVRSLPFFSDLDDEECRLLVEQLEQRTLPANEILIRQGEEGDSVFIIARGVVRATHREDDGSSRSTTMIAGDFFGEIALLHGGTRTATCMTVTPTALYELSRGTVLALAEDHPPIRDALERADQARNEALSDGRGAGSARSGAGG